MNEIKFAKKEEKFKKKKNYGIFRKYKIQIVSINTVSSDVISILKLFQCD